MSTADDLPVTDRVLPATPPPTYALCKLVDIAELLDEAPTVTDLRQLLAKVKEGRFFVACVGQFKRGKSTLLNALVGEQVLPTGVAPVTAVPTVLRYGVTPAVRILQDNTWRTVKPEDLPQYVSEELNPENTKRVAGVEVYLSCPLLASGMCLVDTPGIGSVFVGNTETTKGFIPQIDAAVLVIGADPPVSGEELALIEAVSANVDEILIVLNKIDRVSITERREAATFAGKVLRARMKKPVQRIYEVCALNRTGNSRPPDDWDELVHDLAQLAATSGQALALSAAERGVQRFSASLRRSIGERIRALQLPIADSERRIIALRETVREAEQSLRDLGALFSAEQLRLSSTLLARRKEFLRGVKPTASRQLAGECDSVTTAFGPPKRRQFMAAAQSVARRHVMPWLDTEEAQAAELYGAVTQRFVTMVNELLQQLDKLPPGQLAHLVGPLDADQCFRIRSHFYFHDIINVARPTSPLLYVKDVLLGACQIDRPFRKAAEEFLEHLLDTNASRVQGDVEQRVVESRSWLESEVRRQLREICSSAEEGLAEARKITAAGINAVENEVQRLQGLLQHLDAVAAPPSLN